MIGRPVEEVCSNSPPSATSRRLPAPAAAGLAHVSGDDGDLGEPTFEPGAEGTRMRRLLDAGTRVGS
jgi:hypothetical protein